MSLHPTLRGARACIFDAGGTLVHPDWPRLAEFAARVAGREFAPAELERALKGILREYSLRLQQGGEHGPDEKRPHWTFRKMYCSLGVDEETCERVIEVLDAAHAERHVWCGLDPDATRVVDELKRAGLVVAVISNTEDGRAADALEAAGLASHFDLIIDSHVVRIRKPA
ncbi:MAG TPA: HAD family hydrolase, partial [Pyrinomonadaceae bacterium]|nr:HAD family hydrolase [Pyrinomonadaceae bacterium]